MKLRAGDLVEVRGKEEILKTLGTLGQVDGLPFMPQMFQHCGERYRVYKRAHKTCDTVNRTGGRSISDCVHLEVRCDGAEQGDCQAACLIFWKTVWLKRVHPGQRTVSPGDSRGNAAAAQKPGCTESEVRSATLRRDEQTGEIRYLCQATQLPYFSTPLPFWDLRQYLEDYTSGNVALPQLFSGLGYAAFGRLYRLLKNRRGGFSLLRVYDYFQSLWGGVPYPRWTGSVLAGKPTPHLPLDLKPGDLVRVKSYGAILATLDANNKNRGLYFDAEMVPYCGGSYRVRNRVDSFVDEKSGKTINLKIPAVILEDVWCHARYSDCRMFCPRSIYSWWRETWLERG